MFSTTKAIVERRITVHVSAEYRDILPTYLQSRRAEAAALVQALAYGDVERARAFGLQLKATGAAFGLQELSRLGSILESAAKVGAIGSVRAAATRLASHLRRLDVVYGAIGEPPLRRSRSR